jgi:hypothetical protein
MEAIGFSRECDLLLIVSSQGLGVFDAQAGRVVARDESPDWDAVMDDRNLRCMGIGPLGNEVIDLCGIDGGGLPMESRRGEHLEILSACFPESRAVFHPQAKPFDVYKQPGAVSILDGYIRYGGFSWSGNCIAVADEDLHVWQRGG